MKKIIILGGNGRIGRPAALAFDKNGFDTTIVTRNGSVKGSIPASIKIIAADCLDQAQLIAADLSPKNSSIFC